MDWKEKLSSLKADLPEGEEAKVETTKTIDKKQSEPLRVEIDKRNGKPATLITEFQGTDEALKELARKLKLECGAGGSARDGEILIQGNFKQKIAEKLKAEGYKVKVIG